MKRVYLGHPPIDEKRFRQWLLEFLRAVETASEQDLAVVANDFTLGDYTPTRTLDAPTATTEDVANVLCTLIADMRSFGMKRNQ